MASNVRFIDSLKVGAYSSDNSGGGSGGITVNPNVNNFLLTATGGNTIKGELELQFDGASLGIGGASSGPRLEILDNNSGKDLMLIRNVAGKGLKVQSDGVLQILEFSALPAAVDGGLAYSSSNFYVGL